MSIPIQSEWCETIFHHLDYENQQQKGWSGMTGPRLQHTSMVIPPGTQQSVRAFYGEVLGLEEKQPPHTLAHLNLVWFAAGEDEMELHFIPDPHHPAGMDQRHICLVVENLEDYQRRLTGAGVAIISAEPIPNRPRFFCRDPLGNLVEFTTILGDYRLPN
jgi:catechol 2,3-dioxygenase-like lactoylglutathione lyase family enzyme